MLITLLSLFGRRDSQLDESNDNDYLDTYTSVHSSSSMSSGGGGSGDYLGGNDDWHHIQIPISEDEDFEVVIPQADYLPQQQREQRQQQQQIQEWNRQRNFQRNQLGVSISKTFTELSKENPDQMEADAIQRAMELSLLDVALVYHNHNHLEQQRAQILPHKILGVAVDAHASDIKTAYRKLARLHHPDKGGEAHKFEEIARAYRSLLSSSVTSSTRENIARISRNDVSSEQKNQFDCHLG